MRFADQRAAFNRRLVNRVVRPLSGRVAMWSLIEHRGRRYRTPVTMFRTTDGVAIMLRVRRGSRLVRNLMDADGGRAIKSGRTFDQSAHRPHRRRGRADECAVAHVVTRLGVPSALLLKFG
jgi:hypothetical protein